MHYDFDPNKLGDMLLARSINHFPFDFVAGGSIATIGAYDGVHLGHQKLLEQVQQTAARQNMPSIVMSFEPMPKEYLSADNPPPRLMRFREKFEALSDAGIDLFFCPRFDIQLKDISPATFIRRILVHALNVRHLVVGDDFRFASRRQGTTGQLERAGRALDFSVQQVPSVVADGERVSSTAIRDALTGGNLEHATRLLGRPYRMSGKVIEGSRLGRTLGYPTANVNLRRRQSAVMGIFAVKVGGLGGDPLAAVASVGTRPTFEGSKPLLEVHIFDFDDEIYGKYIHVDFVARLRSEQKFDSAEKLVAQMHRDAERAREFLAG